jgi:hypothetical protein
MWKRILAHGAAALSAAGLQLYHFCMRALVFVAMFVVGCATALEFLDPAIYAPGRRLTLLGTVAGRSERRVGDLPYAR